VSEYKNKFFQINQKIFSGKVKIVEVTSRFKNIKKFIDALGKMGFQLKRKVIYNFRILLTLNTFAERIRR